MARYLGPKCKICRRMGQKMFIKGERCTSPKCGAVRRGTPPGVHGSARKRARLTDYGVQLKEKQKAKALYGILERQFRTYVQRALKTEGNTAVMLHRLLERRIDNVVYRLGFATSRGAARQLVRNGHIRVKGKTVSIPSFLVTVGDTITLGGAREGSNAGVPPPAAQESFKAPRWLSLDRGTLTGTVVTLPDEQDFEHIFSAPQIIGFYSR